jgi:hypothetical protein
VAQHQVGLCLGACYDWIRRNVLGTKNTLFTNAEDINKPTTAADKARLAKQNKQTELVANVHDRLKPSIIDGFADTQNTLITSNISSLSTAQVDTWNKSSNVQRAWKLTSASLDDALKSQRKVSKGGKLFSDLATTGSNGPVTEKYAGGVKEAIVALIRDANLKEGSAALLNFYPAVGKGAGHAVAISRISPDTYHFFDPNHGVFAFTPSNLARAVILLFTVAYPNALLKGPDDKAYQGAHGVTADYTIFSKKKPKS